MEFLQSFVLETVDHIRIIPTNCAMRNTQQHIKCALTMQLWLCWQLQILSVGVRYLARANKKDAGGLITLG